jgi:tetratricopeptide (TPR) repeat protein
MDVTEAWSLSDDQLLRICRKELHLEHYRQAYDAFLEYCARLMRESRRIPPGILASYGLAVAHAENAREGLKICQQALSSDRRNPDAYLYLARVYLLMGSRRSAIDVLAQGIRLCGKHRGLSELRNELGIRQSPPIPFLPRDSTINVRLGRALRKRKPKGEARLTPA